MRVQLVLRRTYETEVQTTVEVEVEEKSFNDYDCMEDWFAANFNQDTRELCGQPIGEAMEVAEEEIIERRDTGHNGDHWDLHWIRDL